VRQQQNVDRVRWSLSGFRWRPHRCAALVRRICLDFGVRWLIWPKPAGMWRTWPGGLRRRRSAAAPGLRGLRARRAAGPGGRQPPPGRAAATRRDPDARPAPELVDRPVTADRPNQLWNRASAICGLVWNAAPSGTPARARRAGASAQGWGRYRRWLGQIQAMGKLAWSAANDSVTVTWQLSCLPSWPQHCQATPTECLPFLGAPVSSAIQLRTLPRCATTGGTWARTASSSVVEPIRRGDEPTVRRYEYGLASVDDHFRRQSVPSRTSIL